MAEAEAKPETSLLEWLKAGPFTLALCSSFFGYYAHTGGRRSAHTFESVHSMHALIKWCSARSSYFVRVASPGVLQALEEAGIMPAKLCGSSSGSVISVLWARYLSLLVQPKKSSVPNNPSRIRFFSPVLARFLKFGTLWARRAAWLQERT